MSNERPEDHLRAFLSSTGNIDDVVESFQRLVSAIGIDDDKRRQLRGIDLCTAICDSVPCQPARVLGRCLTEAANKEVYSSGSICRNSKVLIVGAGPVGLRLAIECALLGAHTDVVETRSYLSRNNILHLWPYVVADLKRIGIKVVYPQFCLGSLDHIGTRQLQQALLKLALVLGVHVYAPAQFKGIVEPDPAAGTGWRAQFENPDVAKCLTEQNYDVIIGAAGAKRSVVPGFTRKLFRAKMAIAVTANFVNKGTTAEIQVPQIGGVAFLYKQDYFNGLKANYGVELENIVYYKGDTHYFVMTPSKACLLAKGVLRTNSTDPQILLSKENVDNEKLKQFAREAADAATGHQLMAACDLQFAKNHRNEDDVCVFDFTKLWQAEHACYAREVHGCRLLLGIVGDTLLEPFWPLGTGVARGFLGAFDTAWLIRNWALSERQPLELLAERESMLKLLSQTTPENLNKRAADYTIDPITRYGTRLRPDSVSAQNVAGLYVKDGTSLPSFSNEVLLRGTKRREEGNAQQAPQQPPAEEPPPKKTQRQQNFMLEWFKKRLSEFNDVAPVNDLDMSWKNGLAFCALVQVYRPTLIDVRSLNPNNAEANVATAFGLIEKEFGISPLISPSQLANAADHPDKLAMLTYLFYLYKALADIDEGNHETCEMDSLSATRKLNTLMATHRHGAECMHRTRNATLRKTAMQRCRKDDSGKFSEPRSMKPKLSRRQRHLVRRVLRTQHSLEEELGSLPAYDTGAKKISTKGSRTKAGDDVQTTDDNTQTTSIGAAPEKEGIVYECATAEKGVASLHIEQPDKEPKPSLDMHADNSSASVNDTGENATGSGDKVTDQHIHKSINYCTGIAKRRIQAFQAEVSSNNKSPPGGEASVLAPTQFCYICCKPVYIVDMVTVHGYRFHTSCLRCGQCNGPLRPGTSVMKPSSNTQKAQFFCRSHAFQNGVLDVEWKGNKAQVSVAEGEKKVTGRKDVVDLDDDDDVDDEYEKVQFEDVDPTDSGCAAQSADEPNLDEFGTASSDEQSSSYSGDSYDTAEEEPEKETDEDLFNPLDFDIKNSAISLMLLADEMKDANDEMQYVRLEEEELAEKGRVIEESIRRKSKFSESEELISDLLDVLDAKINLSESQSQIMLRKRLVDLQNQKAELCFAASLLEDGYTNDELTSEMEKLASEIADLQQFLELYQQFGSR